MAVRELPTLVLNAEQVNHLAAYGDVALFTAISKQPEWRAHIDDGHESGTPVEMDDGTWAFQLEQYPSIYDFPFSTRYMRGDKYRLAGSADVVEVAEVLVKQFDNITVEDILNGGMNVALPPICENADKEPTAEQKEAFARLSKEKQEEYISNAARATYIGWCTYADNLLAKFRNKWNKNRKKDRAEENPWISMTVFSVCKADV